MSSHRSDAQPTSILKADNRDCASPSSYLGVSLSPKSNPKSVSIAQHAEVVSPLVLGSHKSGDGFQLEDTTNSSWRMPVRGPSSRRLSGRPASATSPYLSGLSKAFQQQNGSYENLPPSDSSKQAETLIDEVSAWLKQQRLRRAKRKTKHSTASLPPKERRPSDASIASEDLDHLEDILKQNSTTERSQGRKSSLKKRPSLKKHRFSSASASSDTEYHDGELLVPSCDAVLDNSRTLSYAGGAPDSDDSASDDDLTRVPSYKDMDAWAKFKFEIVRLTHTLRLKGWRKVTMESSSSIAVERLSGALTNCVYVVSPPPLDEDAATTTEDGFAVPRTRRRPQKLLLRIYGPQVEHLIDREAELKILQRLARKKIGPRMLGTFANGRFEEFFNARPLTPEEMCNADTSRQIAKRMRELHDGIDLLEEERDSGAFVWRNWDKWVDRVEQTVVWLDDQIRATDMTIKPTGIHAWKRRGYICGVEWQVFRKTVEKYRSWLNDEYGGSHRIKSKLVFAHNDTQYGNILRIVPSGESPLLLPANTHKQLVVIDFEYANANLPGLEFANHFTEWCYNYHDKRKPYACNTKCYPTAEEQERFIRAYVRHRPQFNVSTPKLTPQNSSSNINDPPTRLGETPKRSSSSLTTFMLDARTPATGGKPIKYDESAEQAVEDAEMARLLHETKIWRLANSAQWVAWGIVQAKVPGLPDFGAVPGLATEDEKKENVEREELESFDQDYEAVIKNGLDVPTEEDQEEFDYLGYAQHRAMFFWGDAVQLGMIQLEELPEEMRMKIKTVLC